MPLSRKCQRDRDRSGPGSTRNRPTWNCSATAGPDRQGFRRIGFRFTLEHLQRWQVRAAIGPKRRGIGLIDTSRLVRVHQFGSDRSHPTNQAGGVMRHFLLFKIRGHRMSHRFAEAPGLGAREQIEYRRDNPHDRMTRIGSGHDAAINPHQAVVLQGLQQR